MVSTGWPLIRMVSNWGVSPGWSHQDGLSLGWSHQDGLIRMVSHWGGLIRMVSSGWSHQGLWGVVKTPLPHLYYHPLSVSAPLCLSVSVSVSQTESMVFMFAWFETGAYLEASHCFVGAKEGQALINSYNQPSMKHDPVSGLTHSREVTRSSAETCRSQQGVTLHQL